MHDRSFKGGGGRACRKLLANSSHFQMLFFRAPNLTGAQAGAPSKSQAVRADFNCSGALRSHTRIIIRMY